MQALRVKLQTTQRRTLEFTNSLCRVIFGLKPWACTEPCAGCGSCSYKHPSQGQESLCEPGKSISIKHQNDVKDLRWKLSWDRAATWVEEPIGFVPADQVALWKLFTAGHLKTVNCTGAGLCFHLQQLLVGKNMVPHLKVGHLAMCWHHWGRTSLVDASLRLRKMIL